MKISRKVKKAAKWKANKVLKTSHNKIRITHINMKTGHISKGKLRRTFSIDYYSI